VGADAMAETILVINAGSSSVKFALYDAANGHALALDCKGQVEGIGATPHFQARDADNKPLADRGWKQDAPGDQLAALAFLLDWLRPRLDGRRLLGVGHRVVHGGLAYSAPVRLDGPVLVVLETFVPLAPLHQPHNLGAIRAIARLDPDLPQVACFDTGFHRTHLAVADRFALPRTLHDQGVRRYGFHGLSYEYVAERLHVVAPEIAGGRVVVAHLGAGSSLCAIAGGKSIDSSMGFTALDGLMMGTRTGALDPGVILYLLQDRKMDAAQIQRLLYHESGLLGVSGISSDMRALLASSDPRAAEAVELYCFRAIKERSLAGWTGWCSRPASASMRRKFARGLARAWVGLAWTSTPSSISVTGLVSRAERARSPPGSCRPTRKPSSPGIRGRCSAADRVDQIAVKPPSTSKSEPVTNEDSALARNKAALAISSGWPRRFRIVSSPSAFWAPPTSA
jgi:acetate kinase